MTCALTLAALALAAPPRAFAQETTVLAPTAFDVDGGSVTTPALEAGRSYRLVAGGTFQVVGPNITFDHDAAYCYGDNATTPICRDDPSLSQTGLWARYEGSSAAPFYALNDSTPAYNPSHAYELTFTASQSAPLRFSANTPELNRDYVGQLGVALYRQDTPVTCRGTRQCGPAGGPASYSERPRLGQTIGYLPPDLGRTAVALAPTLPAATRELTVDITSTTEQEFTALEGGGRGKDAIVLCFFTYLNALYDDSVNGTSAAAYDKFVNCRKAVLRVMSRCQQLKQQRGGPGICGGPGRRQASASAASCSYHALTLGRAKLRVKTTCRVLPTGAQLVIRRKRDGPALTKVLGGKPKLIIGTPRTGRPIQPDDRVAVTWNAS